MTISVEYWKMLFRQGRTTYRIYVHFSWEPGQSWRGRIWVEGSHDATRGRMTRAGSPEKLMGEGGGSELRQWMHEAGFHVNTGGRIRRAWGLQEITGEQEEDIWGKFRTTGRSQNCKVSEFQEQITYLYTLTAVGEMCGKQWNMPLGLKRQAVRPLDLGFTGVNSKGA